MKFHRPRAVFLFPAYFDAEAWDFSQAINIEKEPIMLDWKENPEIILGLNVANLGDSWRAEVSARPKNNGGGVYQGSSSSNTQAEAIRQAIRNAFAIPDSIEITEEHYCKKTRCYLSTNAREAVEDTHPYPWDLAFSLSALCWRVHNEKKTDARPVVPLIMA